MKQQDGAELSEKEQDIAESGWDPDEIAKHASMMSKVKEVIHSKAKRNIDDAQKKDKLYYDSKHASSEVCSCMYLNYDMIAFGLITGVCSWFSSLAKE